MGKHLLTMMCYVSLLMRDSLRSGGKANAVPVKCAKCGGKGLTNVNQRLGPNQVKFSLVFSYM